MLVTHLAVIEKCCVHMSAGMRAILIELVCGVGKSLRANGGIVPVSP
jgi:hypothetical protein